MAAPHGAAAARVADCDHDRDLRDHARTEFNVYHAENRLRHSLVTSNAENAQSCVDSCPELLSVKNAAFSTDDVVETCRFLIMSYQCVQEHKGTSCSNLLNVLAQTHPQLSSYSLLSLCQQLGLTPNAIKNFYTSRPLDTVENTIGISR